jgi:hypothetical protein
MIKKLPMLKEGSAQSYGRLEDTISLDISRVKKAFPLVAQKLASLGELIGILVGMDHLDESSRKHGRGQD